MAAINYNNKNNEVSQLRFSENTKVDDITNRRNETFESLSSTSFQNNCQNMNFQPRLYKKRWLIVFLFAFYSGSNAFQWIHLNIIGDKIIIFYEASLPKTNHAKDVALDMLSISYMMTYIILIIPANWLLDRKGLHFIGVVGTALNALGAWIKCGAIDPNRFPMIMCGQLVCATAQVFILGIPARLAAVWFGPNEVSTATAIGVFGNQVGCALGFLIPPIIVDDFYDYNDTSDSKNETHPSTSTISNFTMLIPSSATNFTDPKLEHIAHRLTILLVGGASVATLLFILVFFFFNEKPPTPPSLAQMVVTKGVNLPGDNYIASMLRILKNISFVILLVTYGLNAGSYYAIGTLLNPIILHYFPQIQINPGQVGLVLVMSGVVGSIVSGVWLDRTKLFKMTTIIIYLMSCLGMLAFTFVLFTNNSTLVFLCTFLLGFFMTGYLPVGFEFAAELTFPESEGISSGFLNTSAQIFGIVLTLGIRAMTLSLKNGMMAGNLTMTAVLLAGVVATMFINGDLKRQKAHKEASDMQLMSRSTSN